MGRAPPRFARLVGFVRIQRAQVWRPWSPAEVSKTLAAVVADRAARDPDRAAYLTQGARQSWAQYHGLSQRLAHHLVVEDEFAGNGPVLVNESPVDGASLREDIAGRENREDPG